MLGKVNKLVHYKVTVLKTRPRRAFAVPEEPRLCDEMAPIEWEGDTYFGYGYSTHYTGKHFDLWLLPDKNEDLENFVGFGRIHAIKPEETGNIYFTQNGKYLVEAINEGKSQVLLGMRKKAVEHVIFRREGHLRPRKGFAQNVRKGLSK